MQKKRRYYIKLREFIVLISFLFLFFLLNMFKKFIFKDIGSIAIINTMYTKDTFSLSKDTLLKLKGPLGITKVQIINHTVLFLSSPCKKKICIKHPPIKHNGETIICVPNHVSVVIKKSKSKILKKNHTIDAISE